MDRTLIIGIGNELRGDDAAGVVAARRLAERNPAAHLKIVHQLTAEMALGLGDYSTVLFLDADVEASEPTCRPVEPAFDRMTVDPHRMTAAQLLVIARALDEPLPRYAFEVGLPACRFEHGEPLSRVASEGVDSMHACVAGLFEDEAVRT
jgi:hydrogenase maturation protease